MTKIKLCGLTRQQDIDLVNEAEPDYIGFVFAKSRRQVSLDQAQTLKKRLKDGILAVGVFVNAEMGQIEELCNRHIIHMIQLHGTESSTYIRELGTRTGRPIIKAVSMKPGLDAGYFEEIPADFLLLDQGKGGTGKTFDWSLIPKIRKPFFLAGGLNPENLEEAIRRVQPFGVDLSSGVEQNGVKEREKVLQAIRCVRKDTSKMRIGKHSQEQEA